jgi:RNA polymerase sigma-70 factor (ECF subfamily)
MGWLFDRVRPQLLAVAARQIPRAVRPKGASSDVVQEALITAQQILARFTGEGEEEFCTWMRTILLNKAADFRRRYQGSHKRAVQRESSLDLYGPEGMLRDAVPGPASTPSQVVARQEQLDQLAQAMDRLPEEYRQVICLRNWDGLSFPEIGQRMGRSADAARMLWGRALVRLQLELDAKP